MPLRIYCFEASRNGWKSQARTSPMVKAASTSRRRRWLWRTSRVERGEIPAARDLAAERGDPLGVLARIRQIVALAGIALNVIELVGIGRRMDELERAAPDHHDRRDRAFGEIFADRLVVARLAPEMRPRGSVPSIGDPGAAGSPPAKSTSVGRMSTSDTLAATRRGAKRPGACDNHRHAARAFEKAHLVPEAPVAEHLAVIAGENDDRVLGQAGGAERLHQPAEIVVHIGDRAEIGAAGVANLSLRHRLGVHRADMAQAPRMRIERVAEETGGAGGGISSSR